jgi:hypothetical protein
MSKKLSNHETRRIDIDVGQTDSRDFALTSLLSRPEAYKQNLIFFPFDFRNQLLLKLKLFTGSKIAFKNRELEVLAEILADLEYSAESFGIGHVVTNDIAISHRVTKGR